MIIATLAGIAFVILLGGLFHVENERYNNGNCYICGSKYNVESGGKYEGDYYTCPNCQFTMNYYCF